MLHPDTLHHLAQGRIADMEREAGMARLASENRPPGVNRRSHYIRTAALSLAMLTGIVVWLV